LEKKMNNMTTKKTTTGKLCILTGAMLFAMVGTEAVNAQAAEWKAPRRAARKRNPMRSNPSAILAGKTLYLQNCMTCHGDTGKGNGPAAAALNPKPKDLTASHVAKQKDGELYWKIKNGRSPMPSFGSALDRKQIWQVVSYLRNMKNGTPVAVAQPVKDAKASVTNLLDQYFVLQAQLKANGWNAKARSTAGILSRKTSSLGDLVKGDKKQKALWAAKKAELIRGADQLLATKNSDPIAAFEVITRALDALVQTFGHMETETVTLFVCKMGKDKAGSLWLQKGKKALNPFPWSTKMPGCGEQLKSYVPIAKNRTHP